VRLELLPKSSKPQPQDATTKRYHLPALDKLQQGTDLAAAAEPRPARGLAELPPQPQDATTKRYHLPALDKLQQGIDLAAAAEPRPARGLAELPPQR
jgi:hypothetical protein